MTVAKSGSEIGLRFIPEQSPVWCPEEMHGQDLAF